MMRHTITTLTLASALACVAALASPPAPRAAKKTVTHDGVSLTFDTALAAEVRAATAPASPLQDESEKPDGVWPRHTIFTLHRAAGERPAADASPPSIRVCPVDEYRRAFAASGRLVTMTDTVLKELKTLLRERPRLLGKGVPTLPFPDATDAFHTHVRYLKFARGSGVAYLTQSQQDASLINNGQLTYEFRGLTDDGRHYVFASFPAAAPFLPANHDQMTHDGYTLPAHFDGDKVEENARAYAAYVARIKARLAGHPPDGFTPSLRLLDEMLSSLAINK